MKPYIRLIILLCLLTPSLFSQTKEEIKQQAEAQLNVMTPEQIDAKIKELGMTRAEAEAKAKEFGIDLQSYLAKVGTSAVSTTPAASQPAVKVEIAPQAQAGADIPKTAAEAAKTETVVETPRPQKVVVPVETPALKPGELDLFGYSVFKTAAGMFEPRPSIDNDYRIGVGDVLKIALWGETQSYNEYTVDKEGRILVSSVGPVLVAGYTVERANKVVMNAMSSAYSGLTKSPPTIFMDLAVARIRPSRVFMMGEVASPGGYEVSGFSNVFNSLFTIGGPKQTGSMRDIRVIRNGKAVAHVDLYDYLIGSTKTSDVRVNDNDILYVPLRGKTVTIKGAVSRSARFELLPDEQLKRLLEFSGGIRTTMYLERINVDRIVPFEERIKDGPERKILDVDFRQIVKSGKDYELVDGDIITVFPILDVKRNYVTIEGAVWRPGTYQKEKVAKLKDLILLAGNLRPEAYQKRADIMRTYPDERREAINVDLELALKGNAAHNIDLMPEDNIRVYSLYEFNAKRNVSITGHVKNPGTYPYAEKLMLRDLLFTAGGLEDSLYRSQTFMNRAYLSRMNPDGKTRSYITFNLGALWDKKEGDILLEPDDQVHVYSFQDMNAVDRTVSVTGKAKRPGTYSLQTNLTLYDLVYDAVGLADTVYRQQVFLDRASLSRLNDDLRSRSFIPFDLGRLWEKREGDMLLKPGDELRIFSWDEMRENIGSIEISGMVKRPGKFPLRTNQMLYDLVYENVGLTDTVFRKEVLLETADLIRMNPDGYTSRIVPFNLWQLFIARTGDTLLASGDRVIIYPRTAIEERENFVDIFGSVKRPGHYQLSKNMTLIDLLIQAGGYTEDAWAVQAEIARVTRAGLGEDSLVYTHFASLPDLFDTTAVVKRIVDGRLKTFMLQHRDQIFVRPNPAFVYQKYVTVEGEVKFPGIYALNVINERISHVIERAGGLKPDGYARGGRLTRGGVALRTNLEEAIDHDEGPNDIMLNPGDVIAIPRKPGTVTVSGEVNNPGIFGYAKGESFSYYINAAGDVKDSADYAIVTYPEGISEHVGLGWFGGNPTIPDGSSIYVAKEIPEPPAPPEKEGKTTYDFVKDTLAIFVSAVTLIVLAGKL